MTTRGLRSKLATRSTSAARRAAEENLPDDENVAEGEDENLAEGEEETKPAVRRSKRANRSARSRARRAEGEDDELAEGEDEDQLAEGEDDLLDAGGEDDEFLDAEGEDDEFAEGEDDYVDDAAEGEDDLLDAEDEVDPPKARRAKRAKRGASNASNATGERGRIAAIMNSRHASGRGKLAKFLALETSVTPRLATAILSRAGTAARASTSGGGSLRGDAFRKAMSGVPNPRISSARGVGQRTEEQEILASTVAMGRQLGRVPSIKKDR
jgi:hypothetical protein